MLINKFKIFFYVVFVFIGIVVGFIFGVNYAVNNTILMEKILASNISIKTIDYIKENKLEKAIYLQTDMLDTNLLTIDEIERNKFNILMFTGRAIAYINMLSFNLDEQKNCIRKWQRENLPPRHETQTN